MIRCSPRTFIDSDFATVVAIGFGGVVREFGRIRDVKGFCIGQELAAGDGREGTLDRTAKKLAAALCQPAVVEWTAPAVRGDN